jgi:hypothetical protein
VALEPDKNMQEEIESIVKAIESLQQESNPFKDYIFPIIASFFSSMLGAFVAYFTLRHQDRIQLEKARIHTVNDWLLLVEGAMSSLISIKSNYHGDLKSNPFQRTQKVRSLIHSTKNIEKNISSLSFIIPKKDDAKAKEEKWRQLPRIRAMIDNYNFIIELWNKRNELEKPIKEKIIKDYAELVYAEVTREQIFESVSPADFIVLIDLTERAIKYTDDFIVEFNDFMTNFPEVAKSLIKNKYIDRYGPIITYKSDENPKLLALIEKEPEVDYTILADLFSQTVEEVKNEYTTGYE